MVNFLNSPEFIVALIGVITAIGGAIALQIRENGKLNRKLKLFEVEQEGKEREHKRAMELSLAQLHATQVRESQASEERLERRIENLTEQQLEVMRKDITRMEADLQAIKAERQRLREQVTEETRLREQLGHDMLREKELREQLEADFGDLSKRFDALRREKAEVEVENTNLRTENSELRHRLDKLQSELDGTRLAMAELERQLNDLEAKVRNGHDDPPPNGTEPDASNVTHLPITNADGAQSDAVLKPTG